MCSLYTVAQVSDAGGSPLLKMPSRFLAKLDGKVSKLEGNVLNATEKTLQRLKKHEAKLKRKLMKKDSAEAIRLFGKSESQYDDIIRKFQTGDFGELEGKEYDAHLDTLSTALKFLDANTLTTLSEKTATLKNSRSQLSKLENKFDYTEQVKRLIKQRQTILKEQLSKFGLAKSLMKYSKTAHYYGEQIKEYRSILSSPEKLERKLMSSLQQLPAFQQFMEKHSAFAAMFPLPTMDGSLPAGTQTREQIAQILQTQTGSLGQSPDQFMQQQLQTAQNSVNGLKEKLKNKLKTGDEPEELDFKPNDQKTKSFWKRLELGTNMQSVKSNSFFPSTTDIGLSLGYKLSTNGIVGIGASYKLGLGKSIKDLKFSNEGIGLRSFVDWKIKGSFYVSGGYEQNYRASFRSIAELNGISTWQQSGLLGISKIISMKAKVFKKTKLQLLWDFLSYQSLPKGEPIKFRLGYNF
ncbi:MAG TPA: hypothetical protein VGO47_10330 [Chlamydiales bacterium]|nr:hypothetical protein [Chlamydiales bacterium]